MNSYFSNKHFEVIFDVDHNGILNVTATEMSTGTSNQITVKNERGRLSEEELERMVHEANMYRAEIQKENERISAKNSFDSYCFNMKRKIKQFQLTGKLVKRFAKAEFNLYFQHV